MPYLAYDLDALKKVPAAARAAGVHEAELGFGLVRLWEHCWSEKTDVVESTHIAGFFGGDRGRVTQALAAFRFLEVEGECFRVRGAGRYLRISQARSENGKRAAKRGNLKRGNAPPTAMNAVGVVLQQAPGSAPVAPQQNPNSAPALTPSTEHRISIKTLLLPKPEPLAQKPAAAVTEIPEPEEFEPDADGVYRSTAWGFWGWHNSERQRARLFAEPMPPDGLKTWHDEAVARVGTGGLVRAYKAYLEDSKFGPPKGWPFAIFRSEQVWLPRANEPPRKPVRL